jgi:hypothetical protein
MTTNDQLPPVRRRRNRRPALPAVSDVEALINNARGSRLALLPFTASEVTAEVAKEAALKLQEASAKLEQLAELNAILGSRRKRRTATNKPMTNT